MTPAERDRLRALAEEAERHSGGEPWSVVENGIHSILNDTDAAFVAACTPAVVLSLLDALDASERDAVRLDVLDSLDTDALAMVTGRALDGDSLRYLADVEIEQRARAAAPASPGANRE